MAQARLHEGDRGATAGGSVAPISGRSRRAFPPGGVQGQSPWPSSHASGLPNNRNPARSLLYRNGTFSARTSLGRHPKCALKWREKCAQSANPVSVAIQAHRAAGGGIGRARGVGQAEQQACGGGGGAVHRGRGRLTQVGRKPRMGAARLQASAEIFDRSAGFAGRLLRKSTVAGQTAREAAIAWRKPVDRHVVAAGAICPNRLGCHGSGLSVDASATPRGG